MNLSTAITNICALAGITSTQIDLTGIASITAPMRGLVIGQVASVRSVLDTIRNCYFVDCVLADKIYFFAMGGASVATIPYADLGADGGQPFVLVDSSELEVYAQFAMSYSNVDNDHQVDVQLSDRLLSGQESTSNNAVPLDFTAQEAKVIVDTQLLLQAIGMRRASIAVGRKYYYVQAGDPITITDVLGNTYRMRVTKVAQSKGIYRFDCVVDDQSCYTQTGTTTAGTAGQAVVNGVVATTLKTLDTPLLSEIYDVPGYYAAVEGNGDSWRSAGVHDSLDNVTYTNRATFADEAVIGTASNTLGNFTGGNILDIANTLTVNIGSTGSLSSTTLATLVTNLSLNLVMVGSELIQFVTATLGGTGIYTLSGLLRGRRGTEWAISTHAASETVVLLSTSGLRFIPLQTGELGRLRYFKPVTQGQRIATVTAQTFTPMGIALKPFAPINLRANRASTDTVLTWERRTRYSYRITGPLVWSCPLGETSESYVVEIYSSNTYTTLKRTLTATTNNVTYTLAQQTTDFGSGQSVLYAKVYQVSSLIGRGYALTASS